MAKFSCDVASIFIEPWEIGFLYIRHNHIRRYWIANNQLSFFKSFNLVTWPFCNWNVNHNVSEILTHKCHNDCFNEHYVTFSTQRSYWCILFWNYGIYYRFTQLKKHTDDGFQGKNYDEIINSQEFRHAKKGDKFRFLQRLS